jgi:peptidoglycan-N-acetylglucosamine deacetylase
VTGSSWPAGHRSAAAFTFDLDAEEVWLVDEVDAAHRPGVLSQGAYGPRVAVPRILELLRRYEVPATFFVPGRVAERYPTVVEAVLASGAEVAHHGWTHRAPADMTAAEEEDELGRGLAALTAAGATVRGYRAPSWDISTRTMALLQSHGFAYASNLMDDVHPYLHPGSGIVELPVHWLLDDAPHFWFSGASWTKTVRSAAEVRTLWAEEAIGIAEWGALATWTFHPQIIGRPGRLPLLEELLAAAAADPTVWVASADDIATHVAGDPSRSERAALEAHPLPESSEDAR